MRAWTTARQCHLCPALPLQTADKHRSCCALMHGAPNTCAVMHLTPVVLLPPCPPRLWALGPCRCVSRASTAVEDLMQLQPEGAVMAADQRVVALDQVEVGWVPGWVGG